MTQHSYLNRHVYVLFIVALVGLCQAFSASRAQAQEVMNIEQTIDVSELGDATFVMRMKLTASQFQEWQQRYGMNPSLLKREMSKYLTQYDITDFQLQKDEMEREITMTIKARGVTTYRGNGRTEIEFPKNWKLVDQDAHELKFNYIEPVGNGVSIQGHITTTLPQAASDISEPVPAEGGMQRITYSMPVASRSSMSLILGLGIVVLGLLLSGIGPVKGKAGSA